MKYATQESILHDGSMKNGVRFIAIFEYNIIKVSTMLLLACLSMHYIKSYDSDNYDSVSGDDYEAVRFSALVHVEYTSKNNECHKIISYDKWIMC